MSERPIIFSGPMVRALLAGTKTQTRRIVKPQPDEDGLAKLVDGPWQDTSARSYRCPYGAPGDMLWVRETTRQWRDGAQPMTEYVADGWAPRLRWTYSRSSRPSIHMPRAAARIMLRVESVRVERLQEISEDDAQAEGVDLEAVDMAVTARDYLDPQGPWFHDWHEDGPKYVPTDTVCTASFRSLWDSINGERGFSWASNPWVWAITFSVSAGRGQPAAAASVAGRAAGTEIP